MNENTQAVAVISQGGALVSVANFMAKLEQQKQMRAALVKYVRAEMKPRRHFYTLPHAKKGTKPSLSQDGARLLCGLYEVRAEFTLERTFDADGHLSVLASCRLLHAQSGAEMESGTGFCSTRESGFGAARIADQYNNVIKRAQKRAHVDAVLRLPLVSEVFDTGDGESGQELSAVRERFKRIPKKNWAAVAEFIFGCTTKAIPDLDDSAIEAGLAEFERLEAADIDWGSKSLVDDMARMRKASAEQSTDELFPQSPRQGQAKSEEDDLPLDAEISEEEKIDDQEHALEVFNVASILLDKLAPSAGKESLEQAVRELEALLVEDASTEEHVQAATKRVEQAMVGTERRG